MQQYEYKFWWLKQVAPDQPPVREHEKIVYAESLEAAKKIVREEWPDLDPDKAQVERIKGNGEPEEGFPPALI